MPMLYLGLGLVAFAVFVAITALVVRNKGKRILAAPLRRTVKPPRCKVPRASKVRCAPRSRSPGKPCVYWKLKIEHKVNEKKGTPGKYTIYAFSDAEGPDQLVLTIAPLAETAASN